MIATHHMTGMSHPWHSKDGKMADSTITPNEDTSPEPTARDEAKSHFSKAVEEARAGAQALGKEAKERAEAYREKAGKTSDQWKEEARTKSGEAKDMAYNYASEGKAKASEGIRGLSRMVTDNAETIDEKIGVKYGDYARSAAKSMEDAATRLDEKTLEDLGEDAKEFVREKPALAVGLAAAAGFMIARLFRGK